MEILEQMIPVPFPSNTPPPTKKSKTKTGAKRALILFIILMMLAIIHTIIQRLSDTNVNSLFGQLFNKMNSFENFQNISKNA